MEAPQKKSKTLEGKVIKLSSQETVKVRIEIKFLHPKYKKIVKSHKNYLVHDAGKAGELSIGDKVVIKEIRPISKMKTWEVVSKF